LKILLFVATFVKPVFPDYLLHDGRLVLISLLEFDPEQVVNFENLICKGLLPYYVLDTVISPDIDEFVEDSVKAGRINELLLIYASKRAFESVFLFEPPEQVGGVDLFLFGVVNDKANQAGTAIVSCNFKVGKDVEHEFSLCPPNFVKMVAAVRKRIEFLPFSHQLDQLVHTVLEVLVAPGVADHALD
jgi:hypothetical protein